MKHFAAFFKNARSIKNTGYDNNNGQNNSPDAVQIPGDVQWLHFWSKVLYAVLALFLLIGGLWYGINHRFFDLRGIIVQGNLEYLSVDSLQAHVAPAIRGTFFTADLPTIARAIQAEPWVRQAVVQRQFPFYLRVQIQEQKPVALWGTAPAGVKLVNQYGEIFKAVWPVPEAQNLPRLIGPDTQAATMLQVHQSMLPLLQDLGLTSQKLVLSERGSWHAKLSNGAILQMGRGDAAQIVQRVKNFSNTFAQVQSAYTVHGDIALQSVDLRYPNGYAIQVQEIATDGLVKPSVSSFGS